MKKETLLIILAVTLLGIGCSFSIDIGKPEQLEQQIELPSNYCESD